MCEFHESTCNGLGDIWWPDNPSHFSSIDNEQHLDATDYTIILALSRVDYAGS